MAVVGAPEGVFQVKRFGFPALGLLQSFAYLKALMLQPFFFIESIESGAHNVGGRMAGSSPLLHPFG